MLIHEVKRYTNLTKKAIEYYTQKGMAAPQMLENGYRDYGEEDVENLRRIGILRKLGLGTEEIREILGDSTGEALQKASVRRELKSRRNARKDCLLRELCNGRPYAEVEEELRALEMEETIAERLLNAFPGYFGRFVGMHFSRFLSEPVRTEEQRKAYEIVLDFLDHMPPFEAPKEAEQGMAETAGALDTEQIADILNNVKQSIEEPEKFLKENQKVIEWYLSYRESPEYQNSVPGKWMAYMKTFQETSGYIDVFLPAMRKLSPSYAEYCRKVEQMEEKLTASFDKTCTQNQ